MARKSTKKTGAELSEEPSYEELKALIMSNYRNSVDRKENLPQRFGQLVKRLRQNKGLSIRDAEERTTLSASYLYQIERGIRKVPSVNAIVLLSKIYDVPFASLMAAAKYVDPEGMVLYYDQLERAFQFVCQDKRFTYSPLVDEKAVPEDAKRFVVEMYQHFTGVKLIEQVDGETKLRREALRKLRGEPAKSGDVPAADPS